MKATKLTVQVTFADCDPAGIVHYSNIFRWMDAGFHNILRPLGGHEQICTNLGAIGLGLINASAQFRSPIRDGDVLDIGAEIGKWSARSLIMNYTGYVSGKTAFSGQEVRGLFKRAGADLIAAPMDEIRSIMGENDVI